MAKKLRIKVSVLTGLVFLLAAALVTKAYMHPDTLAFWFAAETVVAIVMMFGVNDAIRKGGEA